ncbi:MAG: hypothetical protein ACJ75B_06055 [Flavisolibacter sp.]
MKKKDEEHQPNNNESREIWLDVRDEKERRDEEDEETINEDDEDDIR